MNLANWPQTLQARRGPATPQWRGSSRCFQAAAWAPQWCCVWRICWSQRPASPLSTAEGKLWLSVENNEDEEVTCLNILHSEVKLPQYTAFSTSHKIWTMENCESRTISAEWKSSLMFRWCVVEGQPLCDWAHFEWKLKPNWLIVL